MRAMLALGMDCRDRKEVNRMVDQCRTALSKQRQNGTVAAESGLGSALVWRIG